MNILVFGASGATGLHLVNQALGQHHRVTAFVRDPAKLPVQHPLLTVVQGNVEDKGAVEQVVKGHDAVLSVLGANSPFTYDEAVVHGMAHIIAAMQTAGVKRLVYLSFVGVKESRKDAGFFIGYIAPVILRTEIKGHEAREQLIKASALQWTIVRAPKLTHDAATAHYRHGTTIRSGSLVTAIGRADVAGFMLQQLTDTSYMRQSARIMP
jgi:putative NADH-flavin reductase